MDDGYDDLEGLFGEFEEEEGEPPAQPSYRVTVRGRRLALTHWVPWLAQGGAWGKFFEDREEAGVAIADLTLCGERNSEIAVRFHSEGKSREGAERVICEWAELVGYRQVWLAEQLVVLGSEPAVVERAEVRCSICEARWHDATPEFWAAVRQNGIFPAWCPVCGCELPQWSVRKHASPKRAGSRTRPHGSDRKASGGLGTERPRKS